MVEKIQWFPSNRRISCATRSRPRKNPTNSFSIPIVGICCRWRTSDKKPQPFSKKTRDPPAAPVPINFPRQPTRLFVWVFRLCCEDRTRGSHRGGEIGRAHV